MECAWRSDRKANQVSIKVVFEFLDMSENRETFLDKGG